MLAYILGIWQAIIGIGKDQKNEDAQLRRVEDKLDRLQTVVDKILASVSPGPTARIGVSITLPSGQTIEGESIVAQIKDTEKIPFSLAPVDAKGQPSQIDPSKTTLVPDNPAVAIATINPDGLGGFINGVGVGSTQFTGSVTDANNPSDVVAISPISLTVVSGDTASVGVNLGAPIPQ